MWEGLGARFFGPPGRRAGLSVKGPETPMATWVGSPPAASSPERNQLAWGTRLGRGGMKPATLGGGRGRVEAQALGRMARVPRLGSLPFSGT